MHLTKIKRVENGKHILVLLYPQDLDGEALIDFRDFISQHLDSEVGQPRAVLHESALSSHWSVVTARHSLAAEEDGRRRGVFRIRHNIRLEHQLVDSRGRPPAGRRTRPRLQGECPTGMFSQASSSAGGQGIWMARDVGGPKQGRGRNARLWDIIVN